MKKIFHRLFGGKMTYRRAFIISIVLNLIILVALGLTFRKIANPILSSEQLNVEFMTQQEAEEVQQEVQKDEENPENNSEGGVAGKKLSAEQSNGPDSGTQDPNSYNENGNPNADPRKSSDPGNSPNVNPNGKEGGQGSGTEGNNIQGKGKGPQKKNTGNPGYVDVSGYEARLNANKVYPPQAAKMHRQGTVVHSVTFDTNGRPLSASLVQSSGTASLDKAAYKLIFSGDKIVNTTGHSVTRNITVRYTGQ